MVKKLKGENKMTPVYLLFSFKCHIIIQNLFCVEEAVVSEWGNYVNDVMVAVPCVIRM